MLTLETQEAGTGKWFPIVIYTPGDASQQEAAKTLALTLAHFGLLARVTP